MLTIVLSRHGPTTRSSPEQHLGQRIDAPLSEDGREAARRLGARLFGIDFDRVIASPLSRAQETAAIAAPGCPVEAEARLLEMDYGAWEGKTYEQIESGDGLYRARWEADPAGLPCPDGESGDDVARRVRAFLDDLIGWSREPSEPFDPFDSSDQTSSPQAAAGPPDHRVLVIAHSTLDRIFVCVALGVPIHDFRRRFRQEPASLTVLRFPGRLGAGALALLVNDVSHLRGVSGATWDGP
ncbi:MAG TPA: histidine phosphatase family protein [Candidatus Limnocylindrales bacterium]|nr:histidine phosphatase family protein [Candidatus Limnocylindrales bacterium]